VSKILLVHPRKSTVEVPIAHLGLASLSAVLGAAGHEVMVLDEVLFEADEVPDLLALLDEFAPDLLGFSVYTSTLDRSRALVETERTRFDGPILIGGPHATLYTADVAATPGVDYVVVGEAEEQILDLVARAERRSEAEVVRCSPVDVNALPWPDYTTALGWETMWVYPVLTSRGCPFLCSFCSVSQIASRKWRARDPVDAAAEVRAAKERFPLLRLLNVADDCPTCDLEHFKIFLRHLAEQPQPLALLVDNLRADRLDAELATLMRQAGASSACLGVEHGHPEVFGLVNKRETHDDIRRAAALIREAGLELGLCFVIGLPADSFERTGESIRFAKELGAKLIYWNMAHPVPNTVMYDWFVEHGATIDPPRNYSSYDSHALGCPEPTVSTPEFSKHDRVRARFWATVETDQYIMTPDVPWRLLTLGWRYRLLGPALRSLARRTARGGPRRVRRWLAARLRRQAG